MDEIKKTPDEWSEEDGIYVLDDDGWRRDGKSFDEPITRAEYKKRLIGSTVDAR